MCNLTSEIVWQFGASGISINTAGWFEGDSGPFEDKGTEGSNHSSLNGQDLLDQSEPGKWRVTYK